MDLKRAQETNNHAIACLQAGLSTEAVKLWQSALNDLTAEQKPQDQAYQHTHSFSNNNNNAKKRYNIGSRSTPTAYVNDNSCYETEPCPKRRRRNTGTSTTTINASSSLPPQQQPASPPSSDYYSVPWCESAPIHIYDGLAPESFRRTQAESYLPMYDRAMLLSTSTTTASSSPDDNHGNLVTGIILYNLALTSHFCGLRDGRSSLLNTALILYEMSINSLMNDYRLSMLQRQGCCGGSDGSNNLEGGTTTLTTASTTKNHYVLVLLAAVYNKAQIHITLSHGKESRDLLGMIRAILQRTTATANNNSCGRCNTATGQIDITQIVGEDDLDFFTRNSTIYKPGNELAFAAAA